MLNIINWPLTRNAMNKQNNEKTNLIYRCYILLRKFLTYSKETRVIADAGKVLNKLVPKPE